MDETFRTSVPHIFAAGDVIGYPSDCFRQTALNDPTLAECDKVAALDTLTKPRV